MKSVGIAIMFFLIGFGAAWYVFTSLPKESALLSPIGSGVLPRHTLNEYSFEEQKRKSFAGSDITIEAGEPLKDDEPEFISYMFHFNVQGKKVSGLINIPTGEGTHPVIVMIRGYVDKDVYETGTGTQHGGEELAKNGYITLAPDFLGYGSSDSPSDDALEDRFMTYTTVLELLASVKNLPAAMTSIGIQTNVNTDKIGIWGHSNGGHIALSVLEISGYHYPTVLWAPVSKPFPYSILYYTDEAEDYGKSLRKLVAKFEMEYNAEKYSANNYLDWIKAPIQLHQGGADEAVPQKWSDELYNALKKMDKDIEYFTYPGDDHNFAQGSWNTAMKRSIEFYNEKLK